MKDRTRSAKMKRFISKRNELLKFFGVKHEFLSIYAKPRVRLKTSAVQPTISSEYPNNYQYQANRAAAIAQRSALAMAHRQNLLGQVLGGLGGSQGLGAFDGDQWLF